MTPERKIVNGYAKFEIPLPNFKDALGWAEGLTNTYKWEKALEDLQENHQDLYIFGTQMGKLRANLQFRANIEGSYLGGIMLMTKSMEGISEFGYQTKDFLDISSGQTHFNNLIEIEDNHYEVYVVKDILGMDGEMELTPDAFYQAITKTLYEHSSLERLKCSFGMNSKKIQDIFRTGEYGKMICSSYDSLKNLGNSAIGVLYGACDALEIARVQKSSEWLDRVWNTKIR